MQEKLFIQVKFHFFFFQSKIANCFYSKINDSSRVRTTEFSSSRFWVRVSVVPNIFMIYPLHFSIPEISETLNGSATYFFGTVRQKIFDGKILIPPPFLPPSPPPVIHKLFRYRKFSETQLNGFLYEMFQCSETKQFRRKIVIPAASLILNIFRYQKFSETQKISSTKCFSTVKQKFFHGESIYFPPPLMLEIF